LAGRFEPRSRKEAARFWCPSEGASLLECCFARAAIVPVLLTGCGPGGQRERAALGVPAHRPPIAGMDDRAAELADALERRGQVGDGEVGQGGGVAGARSTESHRSRERVKGGALVAARDTLVPRRESGCLV
jgi:hypothetical protein